MTTIKISNCVSQLKLDNHFATPGKIYTRYIRQETWNRFQKEWEEIHKIRDKKFKKK